MRAPTADYSPISQALGAKTSAMNAGYAAKDASNWGSRYRIQEQSLDISRQGIDLSREGLEISQKNLDLNREALSDARWQNNINFGLQLAQIGLSATQQIRSGKQTEIASQATTSADLCGKEIDAQMNANPDWYVDKGDGTGKHLTDKGSQGVQAIMNKYFPDGEKYGWGMDAKIDELKENIMKAAEISAIEKSSIRMNQNIMNSYALNSASADTSDIQGGQTVSVSLSDGAGGMKDYNVGAMRYSVIEGLRGYYGDTWADNELKKAASEYEQGRFDFLSSNCTDLIKPGTSPESILASREQVESFISSIGDETKRKGYMDSFTTAYSAAVSGYLTEETSRIADSRSGTEYQDAMQLYYSIMPDDGEPYVDANGKEYQKGGNMYLFTDNDGKPLEYMTSGTASAARESLDKVLTDWRASYGATHTQELKTAIETAIDTYNNDPDKDAAKLVSSIGAAVTEAYGDGSEGYVWTEDPVALGAVKEVIKGILPDDWLDNGYVEAAFRNYMTTVLEKKDDGKTSDMISKLSAEEKKEFTAMSEDFISRYINEIVKDPSVYLDPDKAVSAVNGLMLSYGQSYHELFARYNSFKGTEVGTNADAHEESAKTLYGVFSPTGAGAVNITAGMPAMDEPGEYLVNGKDIKYTAGVGDGIAQDKDIIYSYLNQAVGLNISDDFMLHYVKDDEGVQVDLAFPIRGKDGINTLEYVYYNLNTNEWEYSSYGMDDSLAKIAGDADPVAFNNVVEFMNDNKDDEGNVDPVDLVDFVSDKEEFEVVYDYLVEQALEGKVEGLKNEEFDFTGKDADSEFDRFGEMIKNAGTVDNAWTLYNRYADGQPDDVVNRLGKEYSLAIASGLVSIDSSSAAEEQDLLPGNVVEAINEKMDALRLKWNDSTPSGKEVKAPDVLGSEGTGGSVVSAPEVLGEEGTNIGAIRESIRGDLGTGSARREQIQTKKASGGETEKTSSSPVQESSAKSTTKKGRTVSRVEDLMARADAELNGIKDEFKKGKDLPAEIESAYDSIDDTANSKFATLMVSAEDLDTLESMWKDMTGNGVWAYNAYRSELKKIYEWKKAQLNK